MGGLLSSGPPSPGDRSQSDVSASLSLVDDNLSALTSLDEEGYEAAFEEYKKSLGEGLTGFNIDSCGQTRNFFRDTLCGVDTPVTEISPKGKKIVDGLGLVTDWEDVENVAASALEKACVIEIRVSGPDHYWVVIPTSNGNMRIEQSWQGLYSYSTLNSKDYGEQTLDNVKANIKKLAKSGDSEANRRARLEGLLWFCNEGDFGELIMEKGSVIRGNIEDPGSVTIELQEVNWTPLKKS